MAKRSSEEMDNLESSLMEKKAKACVYRVLNIATPAGAKSPRCRKVTKTSTEKLGSQKTEKKPRLDTATTVSTSLAPTRSSEEITELQTQETEKVVGTDTESITASLETKKTIYRDSEATSPMQGVEKSELNVTTPAPSPNCDEASSATSEATQPKIEAIAIIKARNPVESRKRPGIGLEGAQLAEKSRQSDVNGGQSPAQQSLKKTSTMPKSAKTDNVCITVPLNECADLIQFANLPLLQNNGGRNLPQKKMRRKTTPRATTLPSPSPSSSPAGKSASPLTPAQPSAPRMANTPSPSGSEYEEDADVDDEEPIVGLNKGQNRIKRKIALAATTTRGGFQSEDDDDDDNDVQPSSKRARLAHAAAKAMLNQRSSKPNATARTSSPSIDSSWSGSSDGSFGKHVSRATESGSLSGTTSAYETDTSASRVRQRAAGLRNHGKACFHNSVLQCLAHTKPIREHYTTTIDTTLDSSTSSEAEDAMEKRVSAAGRVETRSSKATKRAIADVYKDVKPEEINLSSVFGKLLAKMVYEPEDLDATPHVSPMRFNQAYAAIYGVRYNGEESQDAHESLNQTLNRLKDEERASGNSLTTVESIFQGIVYNNFTCKLCNFQYNMTDDFMELGVTMPRPPSVKATRRGGPATLGQCFDTFGEQEEFPDRRCRNCEKIGGVSKVSSLGHVPNHLAVQVRRWRQVIGRRGHVSLQKIDTKVNFPVQEDFDLSPWVSGAAAGAVGDLKYKLYGVVQHNGSGLNDGHYIAYVRRDDGWWEMDDECTRQVRPSRVEMANPYLLFYRKE